MLQTQDALCFLRGKKPLCFAVDARKAPASPNGHGPTGRLSVAARGKTGKSALGKGWGAWGEGKPLPRRRRGFPSPQTRANSVNRPQGKEGGWMRKQRKEQGSSRCAGKGKGKGRGYAARCAVRPSYAWPGERRRPCRRCPRPRPARKRGRSIWPRGPPPRRYYVP